MEEQEKYDQSNENLLPSIKKLDSQTINKIAAGEVVVSPSGALKEMIENSIDAGATQINILSQKGGFSMLQIQDDGHGIKKEDFPILCERFTTSKIREFDDLKNVQSFGFRGEALASISYVSRVTITSKIPNTELAYTADYQDGVMISDENNDAPRPTAASQGTTIQVNDLFYNNPQRKKSFGVNEEYAKIIDVVIKYSIHYPMIKFTCKKFEDKRTDVSTHAVPRPTFDENEPPEVFNENLNKVRIEIIKRQYGQQQVGKEFLQLLKFWDILEMGANIILSKPNTVQGKKNLFLLFINNRLVENEKLKRTIDSIYGMFQPKGGYSYFVYLGLSIMPKLIDVNVHPTKKTVIFEKQDELCEFLTEAIEQALTNASSNRSFSASGYREQSFNQANKPSQMPYVHTREPSDHHTKTMQAIRMVRTDSQATTLDKFLIQSRKRESTLTTSSGQTVVPMTIMSVKKLIYEFENDFDNELQQMFKKHTYVGMLSPEQVLLQFGTKLVLTQVYPILQEFLYQQVIRKVQQMSKFKLFTPLLLTDLLTLALDHPDAEYNEQIHLSKDELINFYKHKLEDKADLLNENFSIEIDKETSSLTALPMIYDLIKPYPEELPMFILRLASDVDYSCEIKYFQKISEELSHYYAKMVELCLLQRSVPQSNQQEELKEEERKKKIEDEIKHIYEHELFPDMKKALVIRRKFSDEGDLTFAMITCTENLYKVFERC